MTARTKELEAENTQLKKDVDGLSAHTEIDQPTRDERTSLKDKLDESNRAQKELYEENIDLINKLKDA